MDATEQSPGGGLANMYMVKSGKWLTNISVRAINITVVSRWMDATEMRRVMTMETEKSLNNGEIV